MPGLLMSYLFNAARDTVTMSPLDVDGKAKNKQKDVKRSSCFEMPVQYPRYKRADYENMSEQMLDRVLDLYGLPVTGDVEHKRKFAMGAFLWN